MTDGFVVATIQSPWATDASGRSVPVALTVNDDVVTMTVSHHDGGYSYPIIADPDLVDCAPAAHHYSRCGTYHPAESVAYAWKWRAAYNHAYYHFAGDDCTNYMSQILRAGGMAQMREYQTGHGSWWMRDAAGPELDTLWQWTHSWSVAHDFAAHFLEYGLAERIHNGAYKPGDMIAWDWHDDGSINHMNFVYGVRRDGTPELLQHSPNYSTPVGEDAFERKAEGQGNGPLHNYHLRCVYPYANVNAG